MNVLERKKIESWNDEVRVFFVRYKRTYVLDKILFLIFKTNTM